MYTYIYVEELAGCKWRKVCAENDTFSFAL